MKSAKEILESIKAMFDGSPAPQAPTPATTAPAPTSSPAPTVYTLADGVTQISVQQAGATPAPGDVVTLADGTAITVDQTGTITQCTPGMPVASAAPAAPVAAPAPVVPVTQSAMSEIVAKFAVGDPEQRLANLEIVCKALMESEFGYQISANERIESQNQAIAIYQTTLQDQATQLEAANQKIEKYGKVIEGMFELVGKLTELPAVDPKTLTGLKKEKFDRVESKEAKLDRIAKARMIALKELKAAK